MTHIRPLVLVSFVSLVACGGTSGSTSPGTTPDQPAQVVHVETGSLAAAIAGAHRSEENRARDPHRHPAETLTFFGLEPSMDVIEMGPGRGWYTEILAPVLRDHGTLHVAIADPAESEYSQALIARLEADPQIFDQVDRRIFDPAVPESLGPEASADLVVTFRSTHGWVNRGEAASVYGAMFRVLKPGGVLGVVQHRADEGADVAETSEQGYVPEQHVIELATTAGFVLEESSEINANAADDHDHPEGVWTLPPTLRLEDVDRAEWEAIGESDRMTLRFRKPS